MNRKGSGRQSHTHSDSAVQHIRKPQDVPNRSRFRRKNQTFLKDPARILNLSIHHVDKSSSRGGGHSHSWEKKAGTTQGTRQSFVVFRGFREIGHIGTAAQAFYGLRGFPAVACLLSASLGNGGVQPRVDSSTPLQRLLPWCTTVCGQGEVTVNCLGWMGGSTTLPAGQSRAVLRSLPPLRRRQDVPSSHPSGHGKGRQAHHIYTCYIVRSWTVAINRMQVFTITNPRATVPQLSSSSSLRGTPTCDLRRNPQTRCVARLYAVGGGRTMLSPKRWTQFCSDRTE